MRRMLIRFVYSLLLVVSGCGGGGGGGTEQNQPPIARNSEFTTTAGTTLRAHFVASDADGDPLTFSIVARPAKGTVQLLDASLGEFSYRSSTGASGSDSFKFQVSDGTASAQATVTIRFNASNTPPEAKSACYLTPQADILEGFLQATDAESPALLTYALEQDGSKGSVEIVDPTDGRFKYVPDPNAPRGEDSFLFRVSDPDGAEATAEVTVIVAPKVMPLGDSLTSGITLADPVSPEVSQRVGYRKGLHERLTASGHAFDFVGSLIHGDDLMTDPQHEGHGGWTAIELASKDLPNPGDGGTYEFIDRNPADFVLLHIGTNDLSSSPDGVRQVLNNLRRWSSDNNDQPLTVLVARIIDLNPPDPTITQFNNNVQTMVENEDFSPLVLVPVDQQTPFAIIPGLYSDKWHPNEDGYRVMADVWYTALAPRLPKCP